MGQRKVSLAHAASPISGLSDAISVVARARSHLSANKPLAFAFAIIT